MKTFMVPNCGRAPHLRGKEHDAHFTVKIIEEYGDWIIHRCVDIGLKRYYAVTHRHTGMLANPFGLSLPMARRVAKTLEPFHFKSLKSNAWKKSKGNMADLLRRILPEVSR